MMIMGIENNKQKGPPSGSPSFYSKMLIRISPVINDINQVQLFIHTNFGDPVSHSSFNRRCAMDALHQKWAIKP